MFDRKWSKILPVLEAERLSIQGGNQDREQLTEMDADPRLSDVSRKAEGGTGTPASKRSRAEREEEHTSSPSETPSAMKRSKHKSKESYAADSQLGILDSSTSTMTQGKKSNHAHKKPTNHIEENESKKSNNSGGAGKSRRSNDTGHASSASDHGTPGKSIHEEKSKELEGECSDVGLEHVVLSDCLGMLDRLLAMRGGNYFAEPVDAEALGLPDYHEIVTEPMDFSTIKERLLSGFYCARPKGKGKAAAQVFSDKDGVKMREAFGRDVRKVLDNAMLYNPESDRVYKAAASILEIFNSNWIHQSSASKETSIPPQNLKVVEQKSLSQKSRKQSNPRWLQLCYDELSCITALPDAACIFESFDDMKSGHKMASKGMKEPIHFASVKRALDEGKICSYEDFSRMVSAPIYPRICARECTRFETQC